MEGYGLPDLTDLAREIQGRCETAMRAAIRELPDGTYHSELKTDGLMDTPITLRMALTITGDEIPMDFAGTDAQVDRAINCALCYTNAMAMYGVKVCTSPNLPNNEGAWRPITLTAPPGCIVNPQFPAPGGSRMLIGHYVPMLVFGCLGQIVPERVMAACGSPMWGMNQSGVRTTARGRQALRQHVLLQRRHGRQHAAATASPACPGRPTSPRPRSRSASTSRRCASITRSCAPTSAAPAGIAAAWARRS